MRVVAVELRRIQIPLRRVFKHAAHARAHTDAILVSVTDNSGAVGWGEIKPRPYVTGETQASVLEASAPALARDLLASDFSSPDAAIEWLEEAAPRLGRACATLSGFDVALLDLAGKVFGRDVAAFLGGARHPSLPAGVVVGFEHATDKLARYCATLRLAGKTHVKVKVGLEDDVDRLVAVAKVFRDMPIRIDANAAWTVEETIEKLAALRRVAPIASVEQPVPAEDHEGLAKIRAETGVRVMADESVCTAEDAGRLITAGAADIFNVRLGKNGGFIASRTLVEIAERAGVEVHLGTMVGETGVLSAAAETFGRCVDGFACLDGKGQNRFLLEVDILHESSDHRAAGDGAPTGDNSSPPVGAHGLGIAVDLAVVARYQVGPTLTFSNSENA